MGKKRSLKESRQDKGSILVTGVIVLASLIILALPFLFHGASEFRLTEKSYKSYAALSLAEAGVERAIWELNYGDISTWNGDDTLRTKTITSFQASGGGVIGDIDISVYNPDGGVPVIDATGSVILSGAQVVSKTIQVVLRQDGTPLFDCGVFADLGVTLNSNVVIYGNVGTNGTASQVIYLNSNSKVYGDAICGPDGNPQQAIYCSGNAKVYGTKRAASQAKEFPSVEAPQGLPFQGSFYKSSGTTYITGSGEYSSFILNSNAIVRISANVIIYVTGQFSTVSNAQLQIEEGGSLALYVDGLFSLSSNCRINTELQDATKCLIYGTDNLTGGVSLSSNTAMYVGFYMPQADLNLSSNTGLTGAIYGKTVQLNSNVHVTFDEGLGGISGPPGSGGTGSYVVKSWQEKSN